MPIYTLSRELVEAIAREYDSLEALNLSDNCISVLENLQPLSSLTKLDLSGNALTAVSNLQHLTNLQQLYLQNNKIEYVCPQLRCLKALRVLDLSQNRLQDLSSLIPILQSLPSLEHLSLQGNPCCMQSHFVQQLRDACPGLPTMDVLRNENSMAAAPNDDHGQAPAITAHPLPTDDSERKPLAEVLNRSHDAIAEGPPIAAKPHLSTVVMSESQPLSIDRFEDVAVSKGQVSARFDPALQNLPRENTGQGVAKLNYQSSEALETRRSVCTSFRRENGPTVDATISSSLRAPQEAVNLSLSSVNGSNASNELLAASEHASVTCPEGNEQQGNDAWLVADLKRRLDASEGEGASLRSSLQSALLSIERERKALSECRNEVEVLHAKLKERDATVASLRMYIGRGDASATDANKLSHTPTSATPGEDDKGLLETQVRALQEILTVQEEVMANGEGRESSEAMVMLSRWRQEVFQGILARKAAELCVRETEERAAKRLAEEQEKLRKAEYAVKVAQQKTITSDAELKRVTAAAAGARADAQATEKHATECERLALATHHEAEEMARAVEVGSGVMLRVEERLGEGGRLLAAYSRRVAFAEERLQVLKALVAGRSRKVDQMLPPAVSNQQVAGEDSVSEKELQREVDALRAERQVLLARLESHPAEISAAASDAAAKASALAAAEMEQALEVEKEAASQRLKQRETELCAQLSEMEAKVKRAEEGRQEVATQIEEWRVEARAQQAELASCQRSLSQARKAAEAAEMARVEAESQIVSRTKELKEWHAKELAALQSRHEEDHRQGAKAMVTVRQLERQLARLHDKRSQSSATEIDVLESKLAEKDAALRAARRERNALLAEKRAAEAQPREQRHHSGAPSPEDPVRLGDTLADYRLKNIAGSELGVNPRASGSKEFKSSGPVYRQTRSGADAWEPAGRLQSEPAKEQQDSNLLEKLEDLEKLTESLLDDDSEL